MRNMEEKVDIVALGELLIDFTEAGRKNCPQNRKTERKTEPEKGEIPKPQYLKTMFHFDLTQEEKYDLEYRRLVKRLYGIEIVEKPELGKKPSWLDERSTIPTKTRSGYEGLKQQKSDSVKKDEFKNFLLAIKEKIVDFTKDEFGDNISAGSLHEIDGTQDIKVVFEEIKS